MTWRKIAAAAALVASISPALATDQSVTLGPILGGTSAAFTGKSTLLAGGDDIISFLGLPGDPYNFSFNLLSGVAVSSVKVNGLDALLTTTTP